jgi:hypothetical protein
MPGCRILLGSVVLVDDLDIHVEELSVKKKNPGSHPLGAGNFSNV